VTLNEFAVSARNAETLAKLKAPEPRRKMFSRNCRYSPPIFSACRPHEQLMVSLTTNVVSPRPDGKFDGPPKLRAPPAILIWGNPVGAVMSSRMPKSVGFNCALGLEELDWRFTPKRTSLMRWPKKCVWLREKNCLRARETYPNPGMLFPRP